MSDFLRLINSGELDSLRVTKGIIQSGYELKVLEAGLKTKLREDQLLKLLKGVEEEVHQFRKKEKLSRMIIVKINFKRKSIEKKASMIPESGHNPFFCKEIAESVGWKHLSSSKVKNAVIKSDYNVFMLVEALKTGRLSTEMRFESIEKIQGNGKSLLDITQTIIDMNNWGKESSWKDGCLYIRLSGGNNQVAQAVIEKMMDLPTMSPNEIFDARELSENHPLVIDVISKELDKRDSF